VSTVDLYSVLGVERDAKTDEIRTAWTTAVAGLVPTDPSFRVFNQAGEILLDPARRTKYDAELASAEAAAVPAGDVPDRPQEAAQSLPRSGVGVSAGPLSEAAALTPRSGSGLLAGERLQGASWVPTWLLATLLALTLIVGGAAVFFADNIGRSVLPDRSAPAGAANLDDAVSAAEAAVVPVLSYDYRHLAADRKAALSWMTDDFADDYRKTFTIIEQNAPTTKTIIKAEVVGSAVGSAEGNEVNVLLFINRPTSNKATPTPTVFRDQVTLQMVRSGSKWLVGDMKTSLPS
jgi:Mce-associated membrane protein